MGELSIVPFHILIKLIVEVTPKLRIYKKKCHSSRNIKKTTEVAEKSTSASTDKAGTLLAGLAAVQHM